MQLRQYLRVLRRRWRIVAVILAASLLGMTVLTLRATPQYRSTTTLFASTGTDNSALAYQGTLYSAQRVKSYAALATGRELAAQVIESLDLKETPSHLASTVSADVVPDTVLFTISASSPNPRVASRIASTLADKLIARVTQLETPQGKTAPIVTVSVIEPANIPSAPYSPNILASLVLALILGLGLGVVLALARELLDNTITGPDDIARVTDTPVIGHVPHDGSTPKEPTLSSAHSNARGEAFRIIRTALQFIDVDHQRKIMLVTSSLPEEGKTTVAINLAEAFAQAGNSVLLVDADLRQPAIGERLKLESTVGLSTAVISPQPLSDFVQREPDLNVDVLTSGPLPPNPAELLQSEAMRALLESARQAYDVVIVDTAPLLPVADASILAAVADGSLVVVRHGRTTTGALSSALHRLGAVDARLFGILLNRVRGGAGDTYGYGYYGRAYGEHAPVTPAESPTRSA